MKIHPPWTWDGFLHVIIGIFAAGAMASNLVLFGFPAGVWLTLTVVLCIYGTITVLTMERET